MTEDEKNRLKAFLCAEDLRLASDRDAAYQAVCGYRGAYCAQSYHDACIRFDYFSRMHTILDTLLSLYP